MMGAIIRVYDWPDMIEEVFGIDRPCSGTVKGKLLYDESTKIITVLEESFLRNECGDRASPWTLRLEGDVLTGTVNSLFARLSRKMCDFRPNETTSNGVRTPTFPSADKRVLTGANAEKCCAVCHGDPACAIAVLHPTSQTCAAYASDDGPEPADDGSSYAALPRPCSCWSSGPSPVVGRIQVSSFVENEVSSVTFPVDICWDCNATAESTEVHIRCMFDGRTVVEGQIQTLGAGTTVSCALPYLPPGPHLVSLSISYNESYNASVHVSDLKWFQHSSLMIGTSGFNVTEAIGFASWADGWVYGEEIQLPTLTLVEQAPRMELYIRRVYDLVPRALDALLTETLSPLQPSTGPYLLGPATTAYSGAWTGQPTLTLLSQPFCTTDAACTDTGTDVALQLEVRGLQSPSPDSKVTFSAVLPWSPRRSRACYGRHCGLKTHCPSSGQPPIDDMDSFCLYNRELLESSLGTAVSNTSANLASASALTGVTCSTSANPSACRAFRASEALAQTLRWPYLVWPLAWDSASLLVSQTILHVLTSERVPNPGLLTGPRKGHFTQGAFTLASRPP